MKRLTVGISICCAILGSAVILLSGMKHGDEAEKWKPLNAKLAAALEDEHKPAPESSTGQAAQSGGNATKDKTQIPTEPVKTEPTAQAVSSAPAGTTSGVSESQTAASGDSSAGSPSVPENKAGNSSIDPPNSESSSVRKINVNTAQASELTNIPGIGAKKAQAIIDYRNQHGPFQKVSDLDKVKGIGAKMLEKMKPYVEL